MTAILLSLLSAVSYGVGDFIGGIGSKRTSAWSVAFASLAAGGLSVAVLSAFTDGSPDAAALWWSVAAGVGNGFGTSFLYRGLSSGRMGVVAPISGVGATLVPVVVGVATGERPSALVWVGIVAALPGIWLVSREPVVEDVGGDRPTSSGLVDGVLAGLGFGVLFASLGQIPEEAGFWPLALNQVVALVVIALLATLMGAPWVPRHPATLLGVASGLMGGLATGAFLLATQSGFLSVTAVLASLYPAFTVVLAATVLREHVHRHQAVGLVFCAVAVALVAAG
jgi:drug/metabolite transporter (DMT)-like permease